MTSRFTVSNLTAAAGTDIIAVCPPNDTKIPLLQRARITAGAEDQKLFICSTVGIVENRYMVGVGQTSAVLTSTSAGLDEFVEGDLVVVTTRDATFEVLEISSVSGNEVTFLSGPTIPIATRSLIYAFYRSSDSGQLKIPGLIEANITSPYRVIPANTTESYEMREQAGRDPQQSGLADTFNSEGCPMIIILTQLNGTASIGFAEFTWTDRSQSVSSRSGQAAEIEKADPGPVVEG